MAATYTTEAKVRNLIAVADTTVLPTASITQFINHAEGEIDRWFIQDGQERANLIFCANTTSETNEIIDYRYGSFLAHTLYPFINSITTLGYATGDSTYETQTEGRTQNYYASTADKNAGRIRLNSQPGYEMGGIRITYTHGLAAVPSWVDELCCFMAAKQAYNSSLEVGASDIFKERLAYLDAEITRIKETHVPLRRGYMII